MKKIMDGNKACSRVAYLFTEVSGVYPITPSSPMAENIEELSSDDEKNLFDDKVKVIQMQSEAGAAGMMHGSLQAGALTSTYTASQGLLLMIPNMYKIAGEMLPGVMHVAARSLSTHALSIFGDHQDIYATRQTGFAILASSSVQQVADLTSVAHTSALKSSLPFLHFFDGFRTSHELQKIEIIDKDDYKNLLDSEDVKKFRNKALNPLNPQTKGTAQNDDIYFQATEVRNKDYESLADIVNLELEKINKIRNTEYKPFNYYGNPTATKIIIAMGSVCETIKETIDKLDDSIGLIEVHLYRPFSSKYLKQILPQTVNKIAVLDRTKEAGSSGEPLYLDIVNCLKDSNIEIVGGRYGLSSKNTTPAMIKAVYDMLNQPKNNFTIGIDDDVTNLSLKYDENYILKNSREILIYGYGSDGMVTAAKSIIELIGENTEQYVQGYFQYDSKKSGGVTVSHLRFSDKEIRSTYYVENPSVVVLTKESYLNNIDVLEKIEENGIFILNTNKSPEILWQELSENIKNIIIKRKINLYTIDANKIAQKNNIKNKISLIMETAIIKITDLLEYDEYEKDIYNYLLKKFKNKDYKIVEYNMKAIEETKNEIKKININYEDEKSNYDNKMLNFMEMVNNRKGDNLKVSAFLDKKNGTFEAGTSDYEKRMISEKVPKYLKENCIQCNQCSFVCPHGVIRPYMLTEEEYNLAPSYVKEKCIKALDINYPNHYFVIGISIKDCTGCGLCVNVCPGKRGEKALMFADILSEIDNNSDKVFEYLSNNIKPKNNLNLNTIKGTQFKEPKFAFSGACAGCGETPYIKLLTQMFGESMIIANATGCSSIYGASVPSTPYKVPWASSLFEDNAEYGYGILIGNNVIRDRIKNIMKKPTQNEKNNQLFEEWLNNINDYQITKKVYDELNYDDVSEELIKLKDYIPYRMVFTIGGDGWAYDIGYGGIDHVLSSNDNINILVLDTQVYSNTGGQSSKSTPEASIAVFNSKGKNQNKKDLAKMALAYPHVYVAQVSLGYNGAQLIKSFNEAAKYDGPSIIIAYSPCIEHGIEGGMENSIYMEKLATESGYFPIFRYNPQNKKFTLDSKNVNFDLYNEFLNKQSRFKMLKQINPNYADELIKLNIENAKIRYEYYQKLDKESNNE
ncbi:MAG: pyruvate:ferredoxin (flavodoxin) oxidoreductase [Bacilli bacterium]|nr:pyruvate:ferredoxin (flavodoxin) oxidoreductase [Bacilli bacterium]